MSEHIRDLVGIENKAKQEPMIALIGCRQDRVERYARNWRYSCLTLVVALVVLSLSALEAWGQGGGKAARAKLDVVLLFDASGSMLKTDPRNLRYEGAELLLSFLDDGDRLGIVQFASSAKVIQDMEAFSSAQVARATEKIQGIAAEGVFTDIAEGIKLARAILELNPRADAQRVIVLLSDGKVEPDPKVSPAFARTLELVHDILPGLRSKETRVFTLAFSDQADRAFLAEMAAATDGLTWFTQTSEDVHRSFAELFLAMKRPQVVAQTGRGFVIDADVSEATFYINHLPGETLSLISPKGDEYSAQRQPQPISWFSGTNFDVMTIAEPDEGEWHVVGTQEQDGFATVLTNLRLLTDWPLVVRAGDELLVQARLYENEKPVSIPEMGQVLKLGFQISPTDKVAQPVFQEPLNDEAQQGDKVARDGIFSRSVPPLQVGAYTLEVVAKGPTFQRSQKLPFTVRPRLVALTVKQHDMAFDEDAQVASPALPEEPGHGAPATDGVPESSSAHRGPVEYAGDESAEFVVELSKEVTSFKKVEVSVVALSSDRERVELPVVRATGSGREFRARASDLPKDGVYKLKAVLKAQARKGEEVEAESPMLTFSLTSKVQRPLVKTGDHSKAEVKHEEHDNSGKLPVIPIALVSLFNIAALGAAYFLVKSKKNKAAAGGQKYIPHRQLLDAMATLEERVSETTIDMDDPSFDLLNAEEPTKSLEADELQAAAQRSAEQEKAE